MNDDTIPKQSGCPTCHCTLWSEQDDLEPAVIRDALRWRQLQQDGGLAAVAEEREACAKLVEEMGAYTDWNESAVDLAAQIRERRE